MRARAPVDGAEGDETPLAYLLAVMRDETADIERRIERAVAAAPYMRVRKSGPAAVGAVARKALLCGVCAAPQPLSTGGRSDQKCQMMSAEKTVSLSLLPLSNAFASRDEYQATSGRNVTDGENQCCHPIA